jgi:hypothetical protein
MRSPFGDTAIDVSLCTYRRPMRSAGDGTIIAAVEYAPQVRLALIAKKAGSPTNNARVVEHVQRYLALLINAIGT